LIRQQGAEVLEDLQLRACELCQVVGHFPFNLPPRVVHDNRNVQVEQMAVVPEANARVAARRAVDQNEIVVGRQLGLEDSQIVPAVDLRRFDVARRVLVPVGRVVLDGSQPVVL